MGSKKLSEIVLSIVLLISGAALWLASQKIEVGAAMGQGGDFMPKLCSTVWVILSVLLLLQSVSMKEEGEESRISLKGFFSTLVLLFAYVLLLDIIGFVLTSVIYMFIQMLLFVPEEYRNRKSLILFAVISVITPVAVNALFFNVFSLILPTGIF